MLEFKELRSGKDFAYFMQRAIKLKEWERNSHVHLVNKSNHRCFMSVYDYDIKITLVTIILCVIGFVRNVFRK